MSKVSFGLKNVHYATFKQTTPGVYEYNTPVKIPGAVELSLENNSSESPFYADNTIYYNTYSVGTYTGSLTIAKLPEQFAIEILGEKKVAGADLLFEDNSNESKEFALLFQIENDEKNDKFCLFRCSASRPGLSGATTTDTVEPNTVELTFTAIAREGDEKIKIRTTDTTPEGVHEAWFDRVLDGTVVNTPAVNKAVAHTRKAATNAEFSIKSTGGAIPNGLLLNGTEVSNDGGAGPNTNWQVQDAKIILKADYINKLPDSTAQAPHKLTIKTDKGNYVVLELALSGVV